jgi:periplasmic protein TonB
MFEGSLVESRGFVVSGTKRWTTVGSAAFQFAVAGLLVAIPLLHPEILPTHFDPPALVAPITNPPVVQVKMQPASSSSTSVSVPASTVPATSVRSALLHPSGAEVGPEPAIATGIQLGGEPLGAALVGIGPTGPSANVSVAPTRTNGPVHVSSGVTSGMLLSPILPVYPAIAKAAHIEGAVIMEAVISKAGRIESLHVVSGPEMLRRAALDAVQAARYQPYRLNGELTEVQTTITVVFRLGS